ncbi:MAG: DUF2378 family protein [Archangium sp.]
MTQRLYYAVAIEGTFKLGPGARLTEAQRVTLRDEYGIDPFNTLPAYPVEQMQKGIGFLQRELFADMPLEKSEDLLGALSFRGFAQTLIGKAIVQMMRLIGPERTMPRMSKNLKAGTTFMEITSRKLAPGRFELQVSDVGGLPNFYRGMFAEGLTLTRAKNLAVSIASVHGRGATYRITWDA